MWEMEVLSEFVYSWKKFSRGKLKAQQGEDTQTGAKPLKREKGWVQRKVE